MMKMVDLSVYGAIKSLTEGTLSGATQVYGLNESAVGLCHLYDLDSEFADNGPADMTAQLENEVMPAVKAAVEKIKSGDMCVTDHVEIFPCDNPPPEGGMGQ